MIKYMFSVSSIEPEKGPKPCADHNCESSRRLAKVCFVRLGEKKEHAQCVSKNPSYL